MTDQEFKKYFKRTVVSNLVFWGVMTYFVIYIVFTDQYLGTTVTGDITLPAGSSQESILAWVGIITGAGGALAMLLAGWLAFLSWLELIFEVVAFFYDLAVSKLIEKRS